MADIGKNEANKMANAVETRIKQIAQQVYKEVPNDKEVEGIVISKNSQNRYTLKINNAIYTNIMQERSLGDIALNTIVKVKIPNNQINNAYICGVVDGSIIKQSGGGGGSSVSVIDSLDSTSTTDALSANQGRVLNSKINANSNEITALNNNKANKSDLNSLANVVDDHSGDISSLQTDVSNLQQGISNHTAAINSLKETKADKTALELTNQNVANNASKIAALQTSKANVADLTSLQERVETNEENISTLQSNVETNTNAISALDSAKLDKSGGVVGDLVLNGSLYDANAKPIITQGQGTIAIGSTETQLNFEGKSARPTYTSPENGQTLDIALETDLENKADINASNLGADDIASWRTKLSIPNAAKLYSTTGQNADGAMTQKATTAALSLKANQTALDTTNSNVKTNSDNISALQTSKANKSDLTDLQEIVSNNSSNITSLQDAVDTNTNRISALDSAKLDKSGGTVENLILSGTLYGTNNKTIITQGTNSIYYGDATKNIGFEGSAQRPTYTSSNGTFDIALETDLENKADLNASNLGDDDVAAWKAKLKIVDGISLYDTTGQNTDGAMTQKATTDALANKFNVSGGNITGLVTFNRGTSGIIGNANNILNLEGSDYRPLYTTIMNGKELTREIALMNDLFDSIYPVGSIYLTVATSTTGSVSPASFFGGNWERLPSGYALWTAASGAGGTIPAGLPNITGTFTKAAWFSQGGQDGAFSNAQLKETSSTAMNKSNGNYAGIKFDANNGATTKGIYGNSTTVQPPAYKVYAWRRVP